jgi:hypothetical protein
MAFAPGSKLRPTAWRCALRLGCALGEHYRMADLYLLRRPADHGICILPVALCTAQQPRAIANRHARAVWRDPVGRIAATGWSLSRTKPAAGSFSSVEGKTRSANSRKTLQQVRRRELRKRAKLTSHRKNAATRSPSNARAIRALVLRTYVLSCPQDHLPR